LLLCDLSESVRLASRYMLELVVAASELFESARSFVFVADLVETTSLFKDKSTDAALQTLGSGALIDLGRSSNYGRVLREADRLAQTLVDKRTTVVLLGDGRTNHLADGSEHLSAIRARHVASSGSARRPRKLGPLATATCDATRSCRQRGRGSDRA
jgi:hypothetical protein